MSPRLYRYPCGIHMGPQRGLKTCLVCERFLAEERARPAIKGKVVEDQKRRREQGQKNGQALSKKRGGNKEAFPLKRKTITAEELRATLQSKVSKT